MIKFHLAGIDSWVRGSFRNASECVELEGDIVSILTPPQAALFVYRQGLQNDVWAEEIREHPHVPRILLERLQDDRDYFAHVFFTLTQGRLSATPSFLDRVFAPENLVFGRQSGEEHTRPPRAREQYDLWSPFEQAEFERVAQRLNLPSVYFPYGYDFSFVSRSAAGGGSWFSEMIS